MRSAQSWTDWNRELKTFFKTTTVKKIKALISSIAQYYVSLHEHVKVANALPLST
jgi:hypothetical protein